MARMLAAGGAVHINEPLNRRHPPGCCPGVLDAPRPLAYQFIDDHNEDEWAQAFSDMLALRYHLGAELRVNRRPYDLARAAKYATAFARGRLLHLRPIVDDPYAVFAAEWLARRFDCRVVFLVRHPAGIVSSLKRIGNGWSDNLPDIAAQPHLRERFLGPFHDDIDRVLRSPFDPVGHACLLYRLIHAAIRRQAQRIPGAVVVRYEDLADRPLAAFGDLYEALGIPVTPHAARTIIKGSLASGPLRRRPWGRVGLSRTAFQPMDSRANAHAWKARLTPAEQAAVLENTYDVAHLFYADTELDPHYAAHLARPLDGIEADTRRAIHEVVAHELDA